MKKALLSNLLLIANLFFGHYVFSQNYTWLRGSNTGTVASIFGTQGVSSPANDPGSRHGAGTWTDASGNLWLFGGEGVLINEEWFSDLWKYTPATNQWTWVRGPITPNAAPVYGTKGVAAPGNDPGPREFPMTWTDASGDFWLFGGSHNPTTDKYADLWKYSPASNQWTWMNGPNTQNTSGIYGTQNVSSALVFPGARYWGSTWVDNNGKFWLFGGRGYGAGTNSGRLGDLWKYDPTGNQWTWISGNNTTDYAGAFGSLSVASAANYPGARECPGSWQGTPGKLILFGGQGYASGVNVGFLNDMWEYNISTGLWTWINGSNIISQTGIYGTLGVPGSNVMPGGRFSPACWTDPMGNYWLFGGQGLPTSNSTSDLNDLFKFNPINNQWTWMKGTNLTYQLGTYGTQGVSAPANTPGSRYYNTWWKNTSSGFLWLFGGLGLTTVLTVAESTNDLWKFRIPCNPDSVKAAPVNTLCSGSSISLSAFNQFLSPVSWYTTPTAGTAVGNGSLFSTPPLTAQSGNSVYVYYAEANSCSITPRAIVSVTVLTLPQLAVTGAGSVCPGQTATLTASGAQSYIWNTGLMSNSFTFTVSSGGSSFTVAGTGSNSCQSFAFANVGLFPIPNITASSSKQTICKNEAVILTATGGNTYVWSGISTTGSSATVAVSPTISTTYTVVGTDLTTNCSKTFTMTQFVATCIGIENWERDAYNISVYPNPSQGSLILTVSAEAKVSIVSQLGEIILEKKLWPGDNLIDTGFSKGVYFLRVVFSNSEGRNGKIIIE